jgi:hypothetical protein
MAVFLVLVAFLGATAGETTGSRRRGRGTSRAAVCWLGDVSSGCSW